MSKSKAEKLLQYKLIKNDPSLMLDVGKQTRGERGIPGHTPIKGKDYFDGENGRPGRDGLHGTNGKDGYTPIRGIDYWTKSDQKSIVLDVLSVIPKPKDGITPDVNKIVSLATEELKKQPVNFKDIKGTEQLIELLKMGGFRGGGGGSGGGASVWGQITGTLSNQTDLQTALNLKANLANPTFTGTVVLPSTTSIGTVSSTEIGYLDGVTSSIQTQLSGKQYFSYVTVGTSNADYLIGNYTDIGAAINAVYTALPANGGMIFIQSGTYSYLTPIVFNTANKFVSLVGANAASTFLKYTPTSGNAITYDCGNPTGHITYEITGFTLMGKSTLIAAGQTNTNTSVGIYYGGSNGAVGINTHDFNVNGFGSNWEIGANAYMLSFNNFSNSGGNGGQASRGSLVHINAASNSGERNVFDGGTFTDPGNSDATNAIYITNAGTASNFFKNISLDNAQILIGASNGLTTLESVHIENPGAPSSYPEYIPILGVSSDSSTMIVLDGIEFANSASNRTWTTLVRHGGQLHAKGIHIDNYNGSTITNFVLHDLNNGTSSDVVDDVQVQGGALTNIVGGSGGVTHSRATGTSRISNVANSYSIGLRPNGSNTNDFFSGNSTVGTFDHDGNWLFGSNSSSVVKTTGSLLPSVSDAGALGSTALMWSDLFLASGSVINFNNGDITLTHSADALTMSGGTLFAPFLTSSGANAAWKLINTNDSATKNGFFQVTYDGLEFGYSATSSPDYVAAMYIGKAFAGGNTVISTTLQTNVTALSDLSNILDDGSGKMGIGTTPTASLDVRASTTAAASLRIRSGSAPTSPNDGDIWFDGTNLKIRIAGATKTITVS